MTNLYENLIRPAMFKLEAERAHELAVKALRVGLGTTTARRAAESRFGAESAGSVECFGLKFANPLGVAAGFDKNGIVADQLASLGFGFVEVGTVTLMPQKGNEKPRLFRLPEDGALINRLGFNNDGAAAVAARLSRIDRRCIVGVNIGKNREVTIEDAIENYVSAMEAVHSVADYIAVNVSSPNTPNLRLLQGFDHLTELLFTLARRNSELSRKPMLVKIAPDLVESQIEQIVDACFASGVDGIIATNTTTDHSGLRSTSSVGDGGLSGKPLAASSNAVIAKIFRYSNGKLPVIGVGGVFDAEDAFEKIAAGASLLQAYTGFVYRGPAFARDINVGLRRMLRERGFGNLIDAVGSSAGALAKVRGFD